MPGRTARIGNEGLATTFVNDKDEPMFDYLVKILLESGQDLPEFWEDRRPEAGENPNFDDNSEDEDDGEEATDAPADAW
jgi:ATP-dependent RNA helicase DDX3X